MNIIVCLILRKPDLTIQDVELEKNHCKRRYSLLCIYLFNKIFYFSVYFKVVEEVIPSDQSFCHVKVQI